MAGLPPNCGARSSADEHAWGGGRPDLAEAGGKIPEKIPEALTVAAEFYREKLRLQ